MKSRMNEADHCITHGICLAEVAAFGLRHGREKEVVLEDLNYLEEAAQVVDTDPELALAAAFATAELRAHARTKGIAAAGIADGLILATARRFKTRVLTGDPHFKGLSETLWLE